MRYCEHCARSAGSAKQSHGQAKGVCDPFAALGMTGGPTRPSPSQKPDSR